MAVHRVVFLVFDGMKMLDVSGPAEVFAEANTLGARYSLHYASPSGEPVRTSIGTRLSVDSAAADLAADTFVVSGGDLLVTEPIPPDLTEAVRQQRPRTRRLVSICTGSFVLAAAALLSGHRATTHWRHVQLLARAYPDIHVEPDALFVEDRGIFTSAGVTAGIDLALSLVERDHGAALARDVARNLVMFMHRPGGQSQFSAPLEASVPRAPALRAVIDLISAQPALEHSTDSLAALVGVSSRHLTRLFNAELGTTPAKFVERVRLDHAKALLDAGHSVAESARAAGFGSPETLRRTFVARLGVSPGHYRARFAPTHSGTRDCVEAQCETTAPVGDGLEHSREVGPGYRPVT
ncbi:HTH-type transcriptional regulator CdhR [Streptomyces sp. RB17]|uniref:GlxA family transcriptional regulator n=1 Tax=Streptomyces sp. RB17 TaxID=2585197 RepID=UPI001294B78D|nr:GlxA family transcriptional regulator [Streptomyces sp. RB17]MQY40200.1 HTH-type transcriptional regulator CdhR [Streptomyces sp. RB17]